MSDALIHFHSPLRFKDHDAHNQDIAGINFRKWPKNSRNRETFIPVRLHTSKVYDQRILFSSGKFSRFSGVWTPELGLIQLICEIFQKHV